MAALTDYTQAGSVMTATHWLHPKLDLSQLPLTRTPQAGSVMAATPRYTSWICHDCHSLVTKLDLS
ncbi:hypothetical protein Hamer_G027641 [Homarus americanus]|uniref:Uncharacterized protein n=1 Tax=Homarus americanus TaxID=6706 RepID=A0A8J5JQ54_HOMAM|nr:hypothetical protein Hamer_G027641 [Homarus americanus]